MVLLFIIIFCSIVALGFGGAAAWSDFRQLKIPNSYTLYIAAAFVPAFLLSVILSPETSVFASWKSHLISGLVIFALTYLLFHFKLIGGGDSKLLSVYALWVGLAGLMPFLFAMALTGGVLGLATLALRKWKPAKKPIKGSWVDKAQNGGQDVPYGIAIFIGALTTFWQNGYIQPSTLANLVAGS